MFLGARADKALHCINYNPFPLHSCPRKPLFVKPQKQQRNTGWLPTVTALQTVVSAMFASPRRKSEPSFSPERPWQIAILICSNRSKLSLALQVCHFSASHHRVKTEWRVGLTVKHLPYTNKAGFQLGQGQISRHGWSKTKVSLVLISHCSSSSVGKRIHVQ